MKQEVFFNMNEFIRDKFTTLEHGCNKSDYYEEDCIVIISAFIDSLSRSKNNTDKTFLSNCMTCMYADTYKNLNFKVKNNVHTSNDQFLLDALKSCMDNTELMNSIKNPDLLFELVKNELEFIHLNEFGKINQFKHLTNEDNRTIMRINPAHKFDLKLYDRYLDTSRYVDYFKENDKVSLDNDPIEEIENFLRKLYQIDRRNFEDNFKEMLKTYYKWTKYMTYNDPKITELSSHLQILSIIEKNSIEDLASSTIETNTMLYNLIDEYIYRSINPIEVLKRNDTNEIITEDKVNAFIIKNSTKQVLEKLGFDTKRKIK